MKQKVVEWVDSEVEIGKGNQEDGYSKERKMKQWQVGDQESKRTVLESLWKITTKVALMRRKQMKRIR